MLRVLINVTRKVLSKAFIEWDCLCCRNTVEWRYNAVQYNMVLHTSLQEVRQSINQRLHTQKAPHSSPWPASYGVSSVNILEKIERVITAPHCIWDCYTCYSGIPNQFIGTNYCQISNIRRTLVGNKMVDDSGVVGASPLGAAPTTSSFSTKHLVSIDCAKTTARGNKKHLSFWDLVRFILETWR